MGSQGTWVLSGPQLLHGGVGIDLGHLPLLDGGRKSGRGVSHPDLSHRGVKLRRVTRGPDPRRFGFGHTP